MILMVIIYLYSIYLVNRNPYIYYRTYQLESIQKIIFILILIFSNLYSNSMISQVKVILQFLILILNVSLLIWIVIQLGEKFHNKYFLQKGKLMVKNNLVVIFNWKKVSRYSINIRQIKQIERFLPIFFQIETPGSKTSTLTDDKIS